jgi:hypothetical protein
VLNQENVEKKMWKETVIVQFKVKPCICIEELRKIMKNLRKNQAAELQDM